MQKAFFITSLAALAILTMDSRTVSADDNQMIRLKLAQKNIAEVKDTADEKSLADSNYNSNSNSTKSSNDRQSGEASESKDQIHAWFTQYDGIRREAEMTMQEKFQVHSLFAKIGDEKMSSSNSEKSEELAKKMIERYTEAAKKIHALPELAATAELQKGYEEFFSRSSHLFHDYLSSKAKGNEKIPTKEEVQAKREALMAFDKKNKEIDAKLRAKYGVKAHRHK